MTKRLRVGIFGELTFWQVDFLEVVYFPSMVSHKQYQIPLTNTF